MKILFVLFSISLISLISCSSQTQLKLTKSQIQTRVNLVNGSSAECMMDRFFLYQNNWKKIKGEHGRNGIDGLYIKQRGDTITDILVAESKYNRSQLGNTKKGRVKQMSKEWILTKLKTVKKYHSQKNTYTQIINHVKNNNYRAKLFTLKPQKQNNLLIILHNIKNKTATNISKTDKTKIVLNYKHPKSKFAKQMIQTYNDCRKKAIKKWFPY